MFTLTDLALIIKIKYKKYKTKLKVLVKWNGKLIALIFVKPLLIMGILIDYGNAKKC